MKRYKDMTSDEKNVVKQHIQLYGGLLLIFVVIAVFLRIYNTRLIQGDGILPTPRKAVDPIGVTYYAQDDPRWADDALGQTGYTMQEEGSLFAALAMVLDSDGITVDPGELNRLFMENDLYINDGKAADLTNLDKIYPEVRFTAPQDFNGENMTNELRAGRACMVRVKKGESAYWLCVVGATEDVFLVLDPLGGAETHELTEYGNVYALGMVK